MATHPNQYLNTWAHFIIDDIEYIDSEVKISIPDLERDDNILHNYYKFFDDYISFLFIYAMFYKQKGKEDRISIDIDELGNEPKRWELGKNIFRHKFNGDQFIIFPLNCSDKHNQKLFCIFKDTDNSKYEFLDICTPDYSYFEKNGDLIISDISRDVDLDYHFFQNFCCGNYTGRLYLLTSHAEIRLQERADTNISDEECQAMINKAISLSEIYDWYSIPNIYFNQKYQILEYQELLPMFTDTGNFLFAVVKYQYKWGSRNNKGIDTDKPNKKVQIRTILPKEAYKNIKPQYFAFNLQKWENVWFREK